MTAADTLAGLQRICVERSKKWHPGGLNEWAPSEWVVAIAGEAGELCGAYKERYRARDGASGKGWSEREIEAAIRDETADVLLYLLVFAEVWGHQIKEGGHVIEMGPLSVMSVVGQLSVEIRRPDLGLVPQAIDSLYLCLQGIAMLEGFDLLRAAARKFNVTSIKAGFTDRIEWTA